VSSLRCRATGRFLRILLLPTASTRPTASPDSANVFEPTWVFAQAPLQVEGVSSCSRPSASGAATSCREAEAAVMPLVVVTLTEGGGKDWRSRPGSEPQYRTLAGIVVEGIEDLVRLTGTVA
jgi:hypothetical protein